MDLGIALTGVAAASPRASKQPRRWNLRTGAEAEERVATCGLAPCNHAGHSWAGIVPADTDALVELNGSLGAASEAVGSVSFPSSHRRLDSSHQPDLCSSARSRRLQQLVARVLLLCVVRIVVVTTKASHCW